MGDAERVGQAGQSTFIPSYSLPRDPQVAAAPMESARPASRSEWIDSRIISLSNLGEVADYLHGLCAGADSAAVAGSGYSTEEWQSFYGMASDYLSNIPATKQLVIGAYWQMLYPDDKTFIGSVMNSIDRGSAFKAVTDTIQRTNLSEGHQSWRGLVSLYNTPLPLAPHLSALDIFRGYVTDESWPINGVAFMDANLMGGLLFASRSVKAEPVAPRVGENTVNEKEARKMISSILEGDIPVRNMSIEDKIAESIASGDLPPLQYGQEYDMDALYSDPDLKSSIYSKIKGLSSSSGTPNVISPEELKEIL